MGPPPCSISEIPYFMQQNTPRRLISTIRSHASSVISLAAKIGLFDASIIEGSIQTPKRVHSLVERSPYSLRHVAPDRECASSEFPDHAGGFFIAAFGTSAITTLAPSRAKARAAARPIPFAAPVTNATYLQNLPSFRLPFLYSYGLSRV